MQPEFWLDRWRCAQIGFHQTERDRHLLAYWPSLDLAAGSKVFVPLCGKSLDMLWLCKRGHEIIGVELSPLALESFCMENGVAATRRSLADFDVYAADRLCLYCGDLFQLTPDLLGKVDAVYDRAALISWTPDFRTRYVEQMIRLTHPGTRTLLIAVEYPADQMSGPPFPVMAADIDALYGANHSIEQIARHDVIDREPRLRARGLQEMHEVCYVLTRL